MIDGDRIINWLTSAAILAEQRDGMSVKVIREGVQIIYVWGSQEAGFKHLDCFTPWHVITNATENPLPKAMTGLVKRASTL